MVNNYLHFISINPEMWPRGPAQGLIYNPGLHPRVIFYNIGDIKLKKHANILSSYRSGDLDTCLDLAERLLQENPEDALPLEYAARVHSKRRNPQLAKPYWHKLTELRPDWPEPFLQAARIARREKDWASCARYADEYIRQSPDHPETLGLLAQCDMEKGDAPKTARALFRLSQLNPKPVPPLAVQATKLGMGVEVAQALCPPQGKLAALHRQIAQALRDAAIGFEIRRQPFLAANCYQALRIYTPASPYPAKALARLCKPYLDKAQAAVAAHAHDDALLHARTCLKIDPEAVAPRRIARHAEEAV